MFKIHKKDPNSLARTGTLTTPHGEIQTPVFMPVGTKASVKTLSQEDLNQLGAEIILSNNYHLYLRPGDKLIKELGGLHSFMKWDKPILTDSGGFQVFSLGRTGNVKIDENGVKFKSHIDGSSHYFTPESAIKMQNNLGSDIIMAFDECAPAHSSEHYFKQAMKRTHNWLTRCIKAHTNKEQMLFGIVQGGLFANLRKESAKFINAQNLPGNAIGGLSVGESKEEMNAMLEVTTPLLDENKPRYLMGVGTPLDLLNGVERGVDMFDCVHPTRIARHGTFWTKDGKISIRNQQFKKDTSPLFGGYSKAYIRHLFIEKEILAIHILTMHNLHFLLDLMKQIRESISAGNFLTFKKDFLNNFNNKSS